MVTEGEKVPHGKSFALNLEVVSVYPFHMLFRGVVLSIEVWR